MNEAEVRALKLRFSGSYSDGQLVLHRLPNGLLVVTLAPELAHNVKVISSPPEIGTALGVGETICQVDGKNLVSPVQASVVDRNAEIQDKKAYFAAGITSTFIVILKLPPKTRFEVPESFHALY